MVEPFHFQVAGLRGRYREFGSPLWIRIDGDLDRFATSCATRGPIRLEEGASLAVTRKKCPTKSDSAFYQRP